MDVPKENNLIMETGTVKLKTVDICGQNKPQKDMQSNRPAMRIQHKMTKKSKKQIVPQEDDKNYQSTKYFESKIYSDKKCQEKSANTWPVEPQMDMWPKEPAI